MSDTPRTDEQSTNHIGFYSCATVPAMLAQGLEREANELRQALEMAEARLRVIAIGSESTDRRAAANTAAFCRETLTRTKPQPPNQKSE